MMNITQLPEEITTIIIRKLDALSQENLCNTSRFFRDMICSGRVIKVCDLSVSTLATASTLHRTFFKHISGHLRELNLSAVNDLDKETLLLTLKLLVRLETLDISYTNLTITDLPDIHAMRPTLRNISINFAFASKIYFGLISFLQYQVVLENFKNVHFVCSLCITNVTFNVAFYILQKAKLNTLKMTFANASRTFSCHEECKILPQFKEFTIHLLPWKGFENYEWTSLVHPLEILKFQSNEMIIIVIMNEYSYKVYATPLFDYFFRDNFNVEVEGITSTGTKFMGKVAIMVWNKNTTEFDNIFFCKLRKRLRQYLPYYCTSPCETAAPKEFNWFSILPKEQDVPINENIVKTSNHVLNYDTLFNDKSRVQLKLFFNYLPLGTVAVALTTNCDFLRKLTFLSLSGKVVYDPEFFNVLFRCCDNLITFNVDAARVYTRNNISQSLSLTHSLKNFRLVQPQTPPITELIASLCNCPTLEIIDIVEEINMTTSRHISHTY